MDSKWADRMIASKAPPPLSPAEERSLISRWRLQIEQLRLRRSLLWLWLQALAILTACALMVAIAAVWWTPRRVPPPEPPSAGTVTEIPDAQPIRVLGVIEQLGDKKATAPDAAR